MSKELNPLQQLDAVLEFLNTVGSAFEHIKIIPNNIFELEDNEVNSPTFESIRDGLKGKITEINLRKVLDKLENNKYIKIDNNQYSITWEGRLFILNGGYMGDLGRNNALMKSSQNNEKAIRVLTRWIAFGTCGLLAWDIMKYLISLIPCCACHH